MILKLRDYEKELKTQFGLKPTEETRALARAFLRKNLKKYSDKAYRLPSDQMMSRLALFEEVVICILGGMIDYNEITGALRSTPAFDEWAAKYKRNKLI